MTRVALAIAALVALSATAAAAPSGPAKPIKPTLIAVAPLSSLGAEDTSAQARKLEAELTRELTAVAGVKVIGSAEVIDAIKKAKKPLLRTCDGQPACLAELGALVGASHVVFGEVGGLGDVQVLYLELVDVASAKEARRAQITLGDPDQGGLKGGAVRLLDPDRYSGRLLVATPVDGAVIYVDGKRVGTVKAGAPPPSVALTVGSHALRVTHPEHRDYVRFVDVTFDKDTRVDVELVAYASIESVVGQTDHPKPRSGITYIDDRPPWYRRWWAVAGFAAVVVTGAVVVGAATADGVDSDATGTIKPP